MSLDAQNFVMLIKRAAVDAVNAKDPVALKIGEVVSVSPLKICLNQKITVPASQLLLTNAVRDHTVCCEIADQSDPEKVTVCLGLKTGEKVLMLRCDGGQKFIVLDRLEAPNG